MVEGFLLIRVLIVLFFAGCLAIPARADRSEFWRYAGGRPEFVGGVECDLPTNEELIHLHRKGYDVCFSPRLRTCIWVAYSLTPADISNRVGRVGGFRRDDDLAEKATNPKSYRGSGYDRGHMAPSQDMQYDIEVSRQSFWMGNIAPQTPRLNRGEWKRLEGLIHRKVVANSKGEVQARRVYVLTGPIVTKDAIDEFEKAEESWKNKGGPSSGENPPMLRPRAFWKIFKYGVSVEAVVMEQTTPDDFGPSGVSARSVTVGEISRLTGIVFFGGLSPELREFYNNICRPKYGENGSNAE